MNFINRSVKVMFTTQCIVQENVKIIVLFWKYIILVSRFPTRQGTIRNMTTQRSFTDIVYIVCDINNKLLPLT